MFKSTLRHNSMYCEVATLHELLHRCDRKLLICTIMEEHVLRALGGKFNIVEIRLNARRELQTILDDIDNMSIKVSDQELRMLLPEESFVLHGRSSLIDRRISARLVLQDDLLLAQKALNARDVNHNMPYRLLRNTNYSWPPPRAYALDSWSETLATQVWFEGIRCSKERYEVLASACWEMVFYHLASQELLLDSGEDKLTSEISSSSAKNSSADDSYSNISERDNCFNSDYHSCLQNCVSSLNEQAQRVFWSQAIKLARNFKPKSFR